VSQKLAGLLGGTITCRSEYGEGQHVHAAATGLIRGPWTLQHQDQGDIGRNVAFPRVARLAFVNSAYYVKAEMRRVLADQQLAFVSRVADEIDQKLALNLNALVAAAQVISPEWLPDVEKLEKALADRVTLRSLFNDLFIHSSKGSILADMPPLGRRGINVSDQENFRTTLATRKAFISKPFRRKSFEAAGRHDDGANF